MSVIILSSDEETDCFILEREEEDFEHCPEQTHQVFIVERFNENNIVEESEDNEFFNYIDNAFEIVEPNETHKENELSTVQYKKEFIFPSDQDTSHVTPTLTSEYCKENLRELCVKETVTGSEVHSKTCDEKHKKGPRNEEYDNVSNEDSDSFVNIQTFSHENTHRLHERDEFFKALQLTSKQSNFEENKNYKPKSNFRLSSSKSKKNAALKKLAEKLAEKLQTVFCKSRNPENLPEPSDNIPIEQSLSSVDETILDVSKGKFKEDDYVNENCSNGIPRTYKMCSRKKIKRKITRKVNNSSNTNPTINEYSVSQTTSFINNSLEVNAKSNSRKIQVLSSEIKQIDYDQAKLFVTSKSMSLTQSKKKKKRKNRLPKQELESNNPKRRKYTHKMHSTTTTKTEEPYSNKLKFILDKTGAVYSVSVVQPSESQLETVIHDSGHDSQETSDDGKLNERLSFTNDDLENKEEKPTAPISDELPSLTEQGLLKEKCRNSDSSELFCIGDKRSLLTLSNLPNIKSNFMKHFYTVFTSEIDVICNDMGYLLLQTMRESKNLINLMITSHTSSLDDQDIQKHRDEAFNNDLSLQLCHNTLEESKQKFIDYFCLIHDQINLEQIVGTQLKISLIIAWFMKMFLSITSKSPEHMNCLHEIKIKAIDLLSTDIVKWPLLCKAFIKDESQFEHECWLVLDFIKECYILLSEPISQSEDGVCENLLDSTNQQENDLHSKSVNSIIEEQTFESNVKIDGSKSQLKPLGDLAVQKNITIVDNSNSSDSTFNRLPAKLQNLVKKKFIEVSICSQKIEPSKITDSVDTKKVSTESVVAEECFSIIQQGSQSETKVSRSPILPPSRESLQLIVSSSENKSNTACNVQVPMPNLTENKVTLPKTEIPETSGEMSQQTLTDGLFESHFDTRSHKDKTTKKQTSVFENISPLQNQRKNSIFQHKYLQSIQTTFQYSIPRKNFMKSSSAPQEIPVTSFNRKSFDILNVNKNQDQCQLNKELEKRNLHSFKSNTKPGDEHKKQCFQTNKFHTAEEARLQAYQFNPETNDKMREEHQLNNKLNLNVINQNNYQEGCQSTKEIPHNYGQNYHPEMSHKIQGQHSYNQKYHPYDTSKYATPKTLDTSCPFVNHNYTFPELNKSQQNFQLHVNGTRFSQDMNSPHFEGYRKNPNNSNDASGIHWGNQNNLMNNSYGKCPTVSNSNHYIPATQRETETANSLCFTLPATTKSGFTDDSRITINNYNITNCGSHNFP